MKQNTVKELIAQLEQKNIKGFLANDEAEALFRYCQLGSELGAALEIGSYCGKSTVLLANAVKYVGSVVFAVDHHQGSEEHQPSEEYFDQALFDERLNRVNSFPYFQKTMQLFNCEDQVIPVLTASKKLEAHWATPLGFVFVDGGHSHEASYFDCVAWSKKLVVGGVLAIHDVFENPHDGGQGPFLGMNAVLESGQFKQLEKINSLVILQRTV